MDFYEKVSVYCLNTEEHFESYEDAAKKYGFIVSSRFSEVCDSYSLVAYGFDKTIQSSLYWAVERNFKVKLAKFKEREGVRKSRKYNKRLPRSLAKQGVICLSTNTIFKSATEAAKVNNIIAVTAILASCANANRSAGYEKWSDARMYWAFFE